jgi:hypothetical protein
VDGRWPEADAGCSACVSAFGADVELGVARSLAGPVTDERVDAALDGGYAVAGCEVVEFGAGCVKAGRAGAAVQRGEVGCSAVGRVDGRWPEADAGCSACVSAFGADVELGVARSLAGPVTDERVDAASDGLAMVDAGREVVSTVLTKFRIVS